MYTAEVARSLTIRCLYGVQENFQLLSLTLTDTVHTCRCVWSAGTVSVVETAEVSAGDGHKDCA